MRENPVRLSVDGGRWPEKGVEVLDMFYHSMK
jgi:hypothetical protein